MQKQEEARYADSVNFGDIISCESGILYSCTCINCLCYDRSKSENVEKIREEKDLKRKKFVPIDREEEPLILKEPYDFENLPPPPEEILCNNYDAIASSEVIERKRKVHFSSMVHILDEVGTELSSFFDKEI